MLMRTLATLILGTILAANRLPAQAPARTVGVVSAADTASRTLTVKGDDGVEVKVKVTETARISQLAPGETSLQNAKPAELASIGAGDRVLARGPLNNGVIEANLVVLMSKTDLAKRQQQEQMAWNTKGVSGVVTAVDKSAAKLTVNSRGPEGVKPVVITFAPNANVKRYAEGSVKYADAKVSSIGDIEVGDQVRALGERSADGTAYTAEQVVSGAFRNIAATVSSIDAASGVIEVVDLDTKKKIQVKIGSEANLRRMPEMAARMMAMMINGGAAGMPGAAMPGSGMQGGMAMRPPQGQPAPGQAPAPAGATRPAGPGMQGGPGSGPGGGMRRPGGDMGQMIDRMPAFQLAELKKDEPLIISLSKTSDPAKAVAITVLAGVEPILATPANGSRAMALGTWNLDGGGGMMGGMGTP